MAKPGFARLDEIVKKTVNAILACKDEIVDISESTRKESRRMEEELHRLQIQVNDLIVSTARMEEELKVKKRRLALVSKNFERYSEQELKEAYEKADNLRIEIAVQKAQEQFCIKRRNELEIRLQETNKMIEKADNMITQVSVAMNYLTGDLQEVSTQIDDMQQKQFLALRIIKAQEEERQRVAREIHDGPAQFMSNVVLNAELCERLLDIDFAKARDELKNLKHTVRDCLADVRRIIYDLRPMSLDDLGLVPTIERYLNKFQEDTGIETRFRTSGPMAKIKTIVALTIFRVLQEAVNNVLKHAKASCVGVNIEYMERTLKMLIVDDGTGFDTNRLKSYSDDINSGFGLISMKERIQLLNGDFIINSAPGKGTRILVNIPLGSEGGTVYE